MQRKTIILSRVGNTDDSDPIDRLNGLYHFFKRSIVEINYPDSLHRRFDMNLLWLLRVSDRVVFTDKKAGRSRQNHQTGNSGGNP